MISTTVNLVYLFLFKSSVYHLPLLILKLKSTTLTGKLICHLQLIPTVFFIDSKLNIKTHARQV